MTMTTRLAAVAAAAMAAPDKIIAHFFTTAAGRGPKFTRIGDSPNRDLTLAGNLCWKVNPFHVSINTLKPLILARTCTLPCISPCRLKETP